MILDNLKNIGQIGKRGTCKILIRNRAPVAQWIERSPPKPPSDRPQVAAAAPIPPRRPSNKTALTRAKRLSLAPRRRRILDSY
jgi:hypothetical protein